MRSAGKDALLLLVATLAALGAILYGAAFGIAPVFQFGYRTVPYTAPAIDINTADEALLMQLPGVGPVRAAAILAYRAEHGAFQTVADLDKVSGISAAMVEDWAGLIVAGE